MKSSKSVFLTVCYQYMEDQYPMNEKPVLRMLSQNCDWIEINGAFFSVMTRSVQNCSVRRRVKIPK